MLQQMKNLVGEEKGQAMTEYVLILGLIAVVVIAALTLLGDQIKEKFNEIVTKLGGTPTQ
ncbi:Flp family type IVb pilin [Effusibacillus lacus]|uniref:Pilus assembly protein n=1 Tax=Effusibacillus lacus TaxID=1348429 RepID=A0A292YRY2_9BACL|nr:Flp family type IVb pilin [Effusibacillus lacus]TCS70382.1 pilus assembly protein Flp/PilA [Effusibacillus lacus]GAX91533.1 pilus assembly protein [Effusibacillus lacus]